MTVGGDKYILWFNVAVKNPAGVHVGNGVGNLGHNPDGLPDRRLRLAQRLALDVVHDEVVATVELTNLVCLN
jgi:hypothetical protein